MNKTEFNHKDVSNIQAGEKRLARVYVQWLYDDSPDLSYLDQFAESTDPQEMAYHKSDQRRKRRYGIDWTMEGCKAFAVCYIGMGAGVARVENFTSGGLWGIESDSSAKYKREVERDELSDLKNYLVLLGFNVDDFDSVTEARQ